MPGEWTYLYHLRILRQDSYTAVEQAHPLQLEEIPQAPNQEESHARFRAPTKAGVLVSDAFSGYQTLKKNDENIRSALCWTYDGKEYADALRH